MALNVAADNANVVLAFNFQVEKRGLKAASFQHFQQFVEWDVDRLWINVATKHNARYHAIAACLTSGALACPRTC